MKQDRLIRQDEAGAQEAAWYLDKLLKSSDFEQLSANQQVTLRERLNVEFPRLFSILSDIYGHRFDFQACLQQLIHTLVSGFAQRPKHLHQLDKNRQTKPLWYRSESMLGMSLYVDLFADDLKGLQAKIPYLQELGITYLHLMPLYAVPEGDSDGGYAVSDYRRVNPRLGDIDDLKALCTALQKANISPVLDFVFNHTADDHRWAEAAKQGNTQYQDYYWMFDDKVVPDRYEQQLREIFPQVRRGNFTWNDAAQKWVWTTFNSFQWDLNYSNPNVFSAIVSEMLFLANLGCEGLRLDALAFIWKEMGTNCENRPNAHKLIQAFNACLQIAAPAVVFKSEAIVHPDEVNKYIDKDECQLSYNPLLMALIWNSLATRKTHLLTESLRKSFSIDEQCSWVNYVRCHDDIGWTFDDAVAQQLGINGFDHRQFLNQFYTGRFDGTFATGVAFGENPSTGDCRVCGSLASLAGLEQGLHRNDEHLIDLAIRRITMINALILSIGGIPLIYAGDELGLLNDYRYEQQGDKQHDGRWVHRIATTEEAIALAQDGQSPQFRIAKELRELIAIRKSYAVFGMAQTKIIQTDNEHVFAFIRQEKLTEESGERQLLLGLFNFSEVPQKIDARILLHLQPRNDANGVLNKEDIHSLIASQPFDVSEYLMSDSKNCCISLAPYQASWLLNNTK